MTQRCQFCGLTIGAMESCPSRTLATGTTFPCEPFASPVHENVRRDFDERQRRRSQGFPTRKKSR